MSLLRARAATTPEILAVFADEAIVAHALAFERALAKASAEEGIVSAAAAQAIATVCGTVEIDVVELAERAALAGTLAIPLVEMLRGRLDPETAKHLHRGATSQDLADTVLMCQAAAAAPLIRADLIRLIDALGDLAALHAETPAIGRTLLQDARPISFGLRLAQWRAGIVDAARQFDETVERHVAIQLGGPVGSRAGLGDRGEAIMRRMAEAFGLKPAQPWHSRRTGVAGLGAALGIVTGAVGAMARDVSLLAQNGLSEAHEPLVAGRGGSSAMAHKRNPTGCQVALSAAIRAPGLVATLLSAMPGELERGLGGWQAEAPVLADLFLLTAGAARAMADVAAGVEIDRDAIARNLADAGQGNDIGESAAIVVALLKQTYPE